KLSAPDRASLEGKLERYRVTTTNEIAVLMVDSLAGDNIDDAAYVTFNAWKLGQSGKDNGVLLMIAPNERKIRIETGKGVGGRLTDLQSNDIIRKRIAPRLKEERFREAVDEGTDGIIEALGSSGGSTAIKPIGRLLLIVILVSVLLAVIA